ncbi:MAG: HDIG domain-containing protein [Candidatus Omnitrophica bacterium]|nr:HDIG domain-containing protein [Candidatus Omnitrophota bacterium]MDE2214519.1 HDIG domain-containing protein [Candidatus Omnitrophota bacterium]MDE2230837.1 HDIG domain-containing protein [Candidatus Omnitrophota bacterium]
MPNKFISINQSIGVAGSFLVLIVFCYFAGFPLIAPLLVFFCGIHLFYFKKANSRIFLHLSLLLALLVFAANAVKSYGHLIHFYLPVASLAMLTMLLFNDAQVSFIMALLGAVVACLILGFGLNEMLIFFLGGLAGSWRVREARTRGVVIEAGILVSVIQVICAFLINPVVNKDIVIYTLKPLAFNGLISAFVVIAALKVFETIFGEITNFTLLELSDSSHPLLKRMVVEAPGSYHHSLIVSNLAEAAADAIGANALLVRVGAYYHDIGKLVNPEYFTENQLVVGNKHDELEPSMSRLVISNHVKEGVELAHKYRLNKRIVDFIPEHHGTSIMYYFYQKALAEGPHEGLNERDYRYPGPKPQSKETAIVLLADSVEGATRALEEHTLKRIEDVVRKVINNKFIDGQLDECNLTLREIDTIASSFVRVLSATYHSRIKYPEERSSDKNS